MKYCIACQELDTDTDKDDPGMPIIIRLEHPCPCSASTTIVYLTQVHIGLLFMIELLVMQFMCITDIYLTCIWLDLCRYEPVYVCIVTLYSKPFTYINSSLNLAFPYMEVQEYTSRYEFKTKKIIGIAYRQYHTNLTKVHLLFPK